MDQVRECAEGGLHHGEDVDQLRMEDLVVLEPTDEGLVWALREADRLFAQVYLPDTYIRGRGQRVLRAPIDLADRLLGAERADALGVEAEGDPIPVIWPIDPSLGGLSVMVMLRFFTTEEWEGEDDDVLSLSTPVGEYTLWVAPAELNAMEGEVYRYLRSGAEGLSVSAATEAARLVVTAGG